MQPNVIMILIDDLGWMDLSCQEVRFMKRRTSTSCAGKAWLSIAFTPPVRSVRPAAPVFCPANIRPA